MNTSHEEISKPKAWTNKPAQRPRRNSGAIRRKLWWLIIVLCLLGIAGFGLQRQYPQTFRGLASAAQKSRASPAQPPPVPVVVATARRADFPIYLDAMGTVTSLNTVLVRSRVDGQIIKVNYKQGQNVKAGDVLIEIDPRPYQAQLVQAQGQLMRDTALLKNAKLDYERYKEAGDEAIPRQQRDTAEAAVEQYEGAIKADQGMIDSINVNLTYCKITAPITGRIGLQETDLGNIVHASDLTSLAVITQIRPITVVFNIAEDYLPEILKADSGKNKLEVKVLNRDKTVELTTGTLMAVDSQIDLQTLTARFKALVPNDDEVLFPNQAVNVQLLVDTKKDAVLIPAAGVQHSTQQGPFIYVVKPDNSVELRKITAGPVEGDTAMVEGGLAPGEVVVTDGVDKLVPGVKVTPITSANTAAPNDAQTTTRGITAKGSAERPK